MASTPTIEGRQALIARRHAGIRRAIGTAMVDMGDEEGAKRWIEQRWQKAATTPLTSAEVGGGGLTALTLAVQDQAVITQLGARRVVFYTRVVAGGSVTASLVAEGAPKPVVKPTVSAVGLTPRKVAAIGLATAEALSIEPQIDEALSAALAAGVVTASDAALLSGPGSLVDGLTPIVGSADPVNDIQALVQGFTGDLASSVLVLSPTLAVAAAGLQFGSNLTISGGTLSGIRVLVSRGSPAGQVTLIDASGLLVAFDDPILEVASQADLLLDTAPVAGAPATTSLWQDNLRAFKAEFSFGTMVARPGSVRLLTGATW